MRNGRAAHNFNIDIWPCFLLDFGPSYAMD